MKHKVGDQVRIRKDLVARRDYGGVYFSSAMSLSSGLETTVTAVVNDEYYRLKDGGEFVWTDEMLESVESFNVDDVVYNTDSERPMTILRKAWVVCYQGQTSYEHFVEERYLTKVKPLTKITKEKLAEMGYELEEQ